MNRRDSLIALLAATSAAAALTAPRTARAQPAAKLPRIGYLTLRSRGHAFEAAFVTGLRELGYVEGKNIVIEWRFAEGSVEKMPALAAELAALRVDVLVTASIQALDVAAAATKTIPVVFAGAADPVGMGFVKSLARPGGNITGISTLSGDLSGKQFELLREAVPRLARLATLVNPTNNFRTAILKDFETVARPAGVSILPFEAQSPETIERAFAAMVAARAGAVVVTIDGLFLEQSARVAALALRHKLPMISTQQRDAEAGSLMSYGATLVAIYHRAATYVDKILKGTKPADLPVEQPTRIELTLNLKTAKALGIKMPHTLMVRADRVIE